MENTKEPLKFSNIDNDKEYIISLIKEQLEIKESVPLSKFKSIESENIDTKIKMANRILYSENTNKGYFGVIS